MNPWNTIFPPDHSSEGKTTLLGEIISLLIVDFLFAYVLQWAYNCPTTGLFLGFIKWAVIIFCAISLIGSLIPIFYMFKELFMVWEEKSLLGWKIDLVLILISLGILVTILFFIYRDIIKPHVHITID